MKKKTIQDLLDEYSITEEWLRWAYVEQEMSLPDIKRQKQICFRATIRLLEHFNIPRRSKSESGKTQRFQSKYQKTCRKKYGVNNVSQSEEIKKKKAKTFVKNYGVDNIWKSKKYYEWLNDFCLDKYGSKRTGFATWNFEQFSEKGKKQWKNLDIEERERRISVMLKNLHKSASKKNTIELKVASVLDALGITYVRQYRIKRLVYDIFIPEWKLILEINGDFWHANPNKYTEEDVLHFPGKFVTAEELWNKDKKKIAFANQRGYDVVTIWESELKQKNYPQLIFDKINENCKNNQNQQSVRQI